MFNIFLFLAIGTFWGGSFVAIKFALESVEPVHAAWLRVFLSLIVLTGFAKALKKDLTVPRGYYFHVWFCGVIGLGIPFCTLFIAEQSVSAGLAGIINGTTPIWTALLGILFLGKLEILNKKQLVGLLIGLWGVVLIFYPTLMDKGDGASWVGTLLCFVMAFSYAVAAVYSRFLVAGKVKIATFPNVIHQHVGGLVFLTLFILFASPQVIPQKGFHLKSILGIVYLATFSTAFGLFAYLKLIQAWGAVRASSSLYLVSAMAIFLDFFVFGNLPTWNETYGVIAVLSGVFLIQSSKMAKETPKQTSQNLVEFGTSKLVQSK